jgi:hypothetical protein
MSITLDAPVTDTADVLCLHGPANNPLTATEVFAAPQNGVCPDCQHRSVAFTITFRRALNGLPNGALFNVAATSQNDARAIALPVVLVYQLTNTLKFDRHLEGHNERSVIEIVDVNEL